MIQRPANEEELRALAEPDASPMWGRRPWPAGWIRCAGEAEVAEFRLAFELVEDGPLVLHVSAASRYSLFLDGVVVSRGPERGDTRHRRFATMENDLPAGRHELLARVWASATDRAPMAERCDGLGPGLLVATTGGHAGVCDTGSAAWRCRPVPGHRFLKPVREAEGFLAGAGEVIEAAGIPRDGGWEEPHAGGEAWSGGHGPWGSEVVRLEPATLPAMLDRPLALPAIRFASRSVGGPVETADHDETLAEGWTAALGGAARLRVPAGESRRVVLDLAGYACFYPSLAVSGGRGAEVTLTTAEALFDGATGRVKGHRNRVDGLFFRGRRDVFRPDGSGAFRFETLWWRAARYLQIEAVAGDEPLEIGSLDLRETRYPWEPEVGFTCDEPRWAPAAEKMQNALQNCVHGTFVDCPFYEQLQYVGDTRVQALTMLALSADDRPVKRAVESCEGGRDASGLIPARWPAREPAWIPDFSLSWVSMVHDFAWWRDDPAWVRDRLLAVRGVVGAFLDAVRRDPRGLVPPMPGWHYVDGTPGWEGGVPPDAAVEPTATTNWHLVATLRRVAALERTFGEPAYAGVDDAAADALAARVQEAFWSSDRGLYADNLRRTAFSEHAQALAVLAADASSAGVGDTERELVYRLLAEDLSVKAGFFSSHLLFEACRAAGRVDGFFQRLDDWYGLAGLGLHTTPENGEPTRSDCHGWGCHPLLFARTLVLGIRPAEPGFRSVVIEPRLGPLGRAAGAVIHPRGRVEVDVERNGDALTGRVVLPDGVRGSLRLAGGTHPLPPGRTDF